MDSIEAPGHVAEVVQSQIAMEVSVPAAPAPAPDSEEEEEEDDDGEEDSEDDEADGEQVAAAVDDVAFVAALVGALPVVAVPQQSTGVVLAGGADDDDVESDSSESDSDDDDDDDDQMQARASRPNKAAAPKLVHFVAEDEDDVEVTAGDMRTKNELAAPPAVEEFAAPLAEHVAISPLGVVHAIVDATVVVKTTAKDSRALDSDSLLCFGDRRVLGRVFETFGPVAQPLYSVLFNNAGKIDRSVVVVGTPVFSAAGEVHYVLPEQLMGTRGSDASNLFDEEIGDDDREFSDDEQEQQYRRKLKTQRKQRTPRPTTQPQPMQPQPMPKQPMPHASYHHQQPAPIIPLYPQATYQPPQQHFMPPQQHFMPPQQHFMPPQQPQAYYQQQQQQQHYYQPQGTSLLGAYNPYVYYQHYAAPVVQPQQQPQPPRPQPPQLPTAPPSQPNLGRP